MKVKVFGTSMDTKGREELTGEEERCMFSVLIKTLTLIYIICRYANMSELPVVSDMSTFVESRRVDRTTCVCIRWGQKFFVF